MLACRVSDLEATLQSLHASNNLDGDKNQLLNELCKECHEITDALHQKSPMDDNLLNNTTDSAEATGGGEGGGEGGEEGGGEGGEHGAAKVFRFEGLTDG